MHTCSRAVIVVVLGVIGALGVALPAQASCVPIEATASPATAASGQRVTVSSSNWVGICNDTGQKIDTTDRAVVTFVQGKLRVELGRTNSNAAGMFRLVVRIPTKATEGRAVLEVRGRSASDDVPVTVTGATLPLTGSSRPMGLLAALALCSALALRVVPRLRAIR
ncbi:MAG: hypothetical protein QOE99_1879 [Actinomycetota bacterium]|nr:hypothetical protein [Actinomycetota bacterium]